MRISKKFQYNRIYIMLELLLNDVVINEKNSSNKDVGMEVFIHVTLDGIGAVGYVDLCYNGQAISYGNYDRSFRYSK